jgi:hypothetical protein
MKYIALLFIALSLLSCRKRLDSFLFNGSKLESYQLDAFTGEVSLELNGQFAVPDSLIHRVHFPVNIDGKTVQVQGTPLDIRRHQQYLPFLQHRLPDRVSHQGRPRRAGDQ